jgi:hypothetical protein
MKEEKDAHTQTMGIGDQGTQENQSLCPALQACRTLFYDVAHPWLIFLVLSGPVFFCMKNYSAPGQMGTYIPLSSHSQILIRRKCHLS